MKLWNEFLGRFAAPRKHEDLNSDNAKHFLKTKDFDLLSKQPLIPSRRDSKTMRMGVARAPAQVPRGGMGVSPNILPWRV